MNTSGDGHPSVATPQLRSLLVTGGAGFIGANFVHYWLKRHHADSIVVLDALTYAGNRQSLAVAANYENFVFVHGDICDSALVADVMSQFAIDTVVHFAAESHVDRSIEGPDDFIRTNISGTHCLLKAARAVWSRDGRMRGGVRFHHVSTDEVYGSLGGEDPPFVESTSYAPNSPYSASKAGSDHLVRAYGHTYGLPITATNCSNNYGPYQFPEKLIPLMLTNALCGRPLPVYGQGQNIRDWLYVEDHCRAVDVVLRKGRVGHTYNVGGCNERRNIDVVHALCDLLQQRFRGNDELKQLFPESFLAKDPSRPLSHNIQFVADRPGHDWRYAIDATKIRTELGFSPQESFATGLAKTIDWYLANATWWRDIQSGVYRR